MAIIVLLVGITFLVLLSYLIKHESQQRFSYEKETRKVWSGFKRDKEALFGFTIAFEDIEQNILKENPNGEHYNNGRKIK